ncbi:DUF4174 domain-containing protein [Pseudomonas putida CSV86]|uniref:DUF4174 domain-containing protein n=1 Tax=Pseudomonas bharatica CSV86 TaxID=1005395 RepID=L1LZC5_9PSED|nr:DUF4174 domain-containing protein [Pseudomonas bharatica]NNJ15948.1 DUF4174 domain-containing protein [Pseudomonas bharatica CSV86]
MLVRSLTLAVLLAIAGPLLADDNPLDLDAGRARPLVVIAPTSADPLLRSLNESLKDPATQAGFKERGLVLYSVAGMIGKRDDKNLEQQTTMALIRQVSRGAQNGTQVTLVGKDGSKHVLDNDGSLDMSKVFAAVDALPAEEKAISKPEPQAAPAAADAKAGKAGKADAKPAKPAKPLPPPKPLED